MFKAIRRILGFFTVVAMILGAIQTFFKWIARSEEDNYEVFADEEV
ncbi:unannotated protein [freshwater metagenome]|uniref:Unannotated protein n=1 Tax=freshwater metagenome TaxID=449393 RepID=A0A6J6FCH8_9ZZZZ|nr:hypothetical protein [Actinomycetota bacterium]MSW14541.1 hypothetical protein [Actinomycetota bacterium]MSW98967.1 hypothetical protein [Actinomycetota bacterium]MSY82798.1 hypothetical protein [Actinomycetota bacterium]MSZ45319.1 hypothetical protein [Actinomycetota bacterium]